MYPSFNGLRDVSIQSSILEKLYDEVYKRGANDGRLLPTHTRTAEVDPIEVRMLLSETACEILKFLRDTHRKPGARLTVATLDAHFGTDPTVAVAISELNQVGYVTVPDAGTVELTDLGFDAIHRFDG